MENLRKAIVCQVNTQEKVSNFVTSSGVARPGPTRACALPSTLQALPSAISFESRDSTMDQTKINCSANNYKSVTNINASAWKPFTISQERVRGVI